FRQYAGQNAGNLNGYNAVQNVGNQVAQNPRVQNVVQGNGNQNLNGNGNIVAVRAEENAAGHNGNQIRCYNCMGQASTSGTQTDRAPVYDSNGSAENDNNVISEVTSVEQGGETVEQHPTNFEETHLNKQLSKEKSTVSFLLEEKKKLKSDFKTRKNELLDKQIQLEKKIKALNNILFKMGQSIQTIHMLSPKPDSFYHTEQKIA
nr:hypothetical protein [Tanacetum cinerariifolium]